MKTVCGHCSFNDGSVYTSLPPKVKCMLTDKFHFMSDPCEIDFSKIDEENGNWHINKPLPDSEDIVEVVRCKDCKYFNWWVSQGKEMFDCLRFLDAPPITPEWYCAWGERREDAEKTD